MRFPRRLRALALGGKSNRMGQDCTGLAGRSRGCREPHGHVAAWSKKLSSVGPHDLNLGERNDRKSNPENRHRHRRQPRPRPQYGAEPRQARRRFDLHLQLQSGRSRKGRRLVAEAGRKAIALQLDTGNVERLRPFVQSVRKALARIWERSASTTSSTTPAPRTTTRSRRRPRRNWTALYNVHFKGVFFLTQKLLPLINDGGRIVNISSGLTRIIMPGSAALCVR